MDEEAAAAKKKTEEAAAAVKKKEEAAGAKAKAEEAAAAKKKDPVVESKVEEKIAEDKEVIQKEKATAKADAEL